MQGFEESSILLPSSDGLGYTSEQRIEPKPVAASAGGDSGDLNAIRAEKRRREIEAQSTGGGSLRDSDGVFSSSGVSDLDAAAERKFAAGPSGVRVSLREQLRLNAEAKDAAWKEKNNPFKPPPALTEEDYNMYMELEESRQSKHAAQREAEAEDYKLFAEAMKRKEAGLSANATSDPAAPVKVALTELSALDPSLGFGHLSSATQSLLGTPAAASNSPIIAATSSSATPANANMPLLVLKRKHSESDKEKKERKSHKKSKKHEKDAPSTTAAAPPAPAAPGPPAAASSALAGLGAYGSDDDD